MSKKNENAAVQYVEDNFTKEQLNQLRLIGIVKEDGTLNIEADTKPNVEMKALGTLEVGDMRYKVAGHFYANSHMERYPVSVIKYADGNVACSTRARFPGNWGETVPFFTSTALRQAWAQLIRVLPGYAVLVGIVKE